MSIAHRLEDEEMSEVSLCDLLVAMGERSTAAVLGWANFVGPLSGLDAALSDPCASTKYLARLKVFFDAGMTPR
jgi:hypothetical protein